MKKLLTFTLIIAIILSFTACAPAAYVSDATQMPTRKPATVEATPTPTPTVYPETKTIEMSELKDYTIIYPAEYNEYRMDIVNELKSVIDTVTGGDIEIAADSSTVSGNKLILASANAEHSFKTEIENFDDAMDYIVAVDGDNIVLGGKNYYADMRAAYSFMESNLGYTSYDNKYTGEAKAINGVNISLYTKSEFRINASTYRPVFTREDQIKQIADGNFTMLTTGTNLYSTQEVHNLMKWSAKYELEILSQISTQSTINNSDIIYDCPMMYGGYIWDEPESGQMAEVQRLCAEFIEKYDKYGWKPFVNYSGMFIDIPHALDCEAICYDWYTFVCLSYDKDGSAEGENTLEKLEYCRDLAELNGQKYWNYIQAYRRKNGVFNASKAYRWQMYMQLCFGVDSIIYFTYTGTDDPNHSFAAVDSSVVGADASITQTGNYYFAQTANKEILDVYDILKDYENVGAYTLNKRDYSISTQTEHTWLGSFDEYEDFDTIEEIVAAKNDDGAKTQYLVGCFEKANSSESAFILMGIDLITDNEYGDDTDRLTRIKINGNPTFYFEGEEVEVEKDSDGYYTLNVANGYCWLVTVE